MQHMNPHPTPVKVLRGRQISQRSRNDGARTLMAANLIAGHAAVTNLTVSQACAVTGARRGHVQALRRLLAGGSLARVREAAE
jgi:hypothetical protein